MITTLSSGLIEGNQIRPLTVVFDCGIVAPNMINLTVNTYAMTTTTTNRTDIVGRRHAVMSAG